MADQRSMELPQETGEDRGRHARSPGEIPVKGLKDVLWRTWQEVTTDKVTMIAAGVTYYLLLALFPALGVLVTLYGFMADPGDLGRQIDFLASILPAGAMDIVNTQLTALATQEKSTLSLAFVGSFAVALWSANNGMKALFEAMNIAYDEEEKRGFVRLNLVSLAFTFISLLVAGVLIVALGVLPAALALIRLDAAAETILRLARWPVILMLIGFATVMLYRYGPSRDPAKLRWLTWGATLSTLLWLVTSIAFSWYLENFADYNATYGTLGALIAFMVWIWLSVTIVIVGAELNAELEHQTTRDSTVGPTRPMGARRAEMADTVGPAMDAR